LSRKKTTLRPLFTTMKKRGEGRSVLTRAAQKTTQLGKLTGPGEGISTKKPVGGKGVAAE